MKSTLFSLFLGALLCITLSLPARAGVEEGSLVTVWGVVVDSEFGLVIHDGVTDYLLLGVSDPELEGKTCEVVGIVSNTFGFNAINVETIQVIGDAFDNSYSLLFRKARQPLELNA